MTDLLLLQVVAAVAVSQTHGHTHARSVDLVVSKDGAEGTLGLRQVGACDVAAVVVAEQVVAHVVAHVCEESISCTLIAISQLGETADEVALVTGNPNSLLLSVHGVLVRASLVGPVFEVGHARYHRSCCRRRVGSGCEQGPPRGQCFAVRGRRHGS